MVWHKYTEKRQKIILYASGKWIREKGRPQRAYDVSLAACTSFVISLLLQ